MKRKNVVKKPITKEVEGQVPVFGEAKPLKQGGSKWYPVGDATFNKYYEVTKNGEIRRSGHFKIIDGVKYIVKPRQLYPTPNMKGQRSIMLYGKTQDGGVIKKSWSLSRLIMITFTRQPDNAKLIRYKDGNPLNIRLDNMEWVIPIPKGKKVIPYHLLTDQAKKDRDEQKDYHLIEEKILKIRRELPLTNMPDVR